jgi:HNH endonuclease
MVAKLPSGCWEWIGARAKETGYGLFRLSSDRLILAHCYSFELHNTDDRTGKVVRHTCDNPPCVNPEHLVLGTHAENSADMDSRGRRVNNPRRGEAHPLSKLSTEAVRDARLAHQLGASIGSLAKLYNVSPSTMASALSGKTWKDNDHE